MTIEQQLELMPIEEEIKYILSLIKKYCINWNRNILALVNKETLEDEVFLQIYEHNKNYFKDIAELVLLDTIDDFYDQTMILINTDNIVLKETKFNELKTNYTLNIFSDYTAIYLQEILKYYKIEKTLKPTNYNMDNDLVEIYEKYLDGTLDFFQMSSDLRKKLIAFLKKKNERTNINFVNSYTAIKQTAMKSNFSEALINSDTLLKEK